jgi:protein-tyrosine phosphatase
MAQTKLLFVCMGNICRSPAAEGIMKSLVLKKGYDTVIECDSAGTLGYHTGEEADTRMKLHAARRGYDLTHRARKFNPKEDFEKFHLILTMDDENYRTVLALDKKSAYAKKVIPITTFCSKMKVDAVPDPYYEGPEGFEKVLDILEDACGGLLKQIEEGDGEQA